MSKKTNLIILILIIILGAILRIYKISSYPVQLNHDEVSQLYDAISVKETGKDIHLNPYPFIFPSIGDFKPPFYTYAAIPFLYLFGNNDYVIRVVGMLFGILLVPAVYYFTNLLFSKKQISIIAALFTAIAPYEIYFSRKGFEGGTGVFLIIMGFGFIINYIKRKDPRMFIVASVLLGMSMFVYFSYAILVPLLFMFLIVFLKMNNCRLHWRGIIIFLFMLFILSLLIHRDPNSANRTRAVALTQDPRLQEVLNKIEDEDNLIYIKKPLVIAKYASARYLNQFNPTFLFINGLDLTNQDPIDTGPFYFFQLPLVLIGIYLLYKDLSKGRNNLIYLLVILLFVGMLPSGLTFEDNSPHRSLLALLMINIVSSVGAFGLFSWIYKKYRKTIVLYPIIGMVALTIIWSISYFVFIYSVTFPIDKSEFIQYPYKKIALIAKEKYDDYEKIIFDPRFGKDYPWVGGAVEYYMAYYGGFPVEKMQQEYAVLKKDGIATKKFGKYEIRDVYWPEDRKLKNTLIIASPWVISEESFDKAKLVDKIYNYQGTQIAFYILSLEDQ